MKPLTLILLVLMGVLVAKGAWAQSPFKRCPVPSTIDGVLPRLEMDITLGLVRLSDDWRKQLRGAANADSTACLAVENAMYDFVEEAARLRGELNTARDAIARLRQENEL